MDRVTVVRSLNHPWNFHGMMWATTGLPEGSIPIEETQKHAQHQPYVGSVFDYHQRQQPGAKPTGSVPDNVILPWLLSSKRPAAHYARPHAAYLGNAHDPLWAELQGRGDAQHGPHVHRPGGGDRRPLPRHHARRADSRSPPRPRWRRG